MKKFFNKTIIDNLALLRPNPVSPRVGGIYWTVGSCDDINSCFQNGKANLRRWPTIIIEIVFELLKRIPNYDSTKHIGSTQKSNRQQ